MKANLPAGKAGKKYQTYMLIAALAFLYLFSTEVVDRWQQAYQLFAEARSKENSLLSPADLQEKEMLLSAEEKNLLAQLKNGSKKYEQSGIGVYRMLNTNAKSEQIAIESFLPAGEKTVGEMEEFRFALSFHAHFHQLGAFLSADENDALPVSFQKVDIVSESARQGLLKIDLAGDVYILSHGRAQ